MLTAVGCAELVVSTQLVNVATALPLLAVKLLTTLAIALEPISDLRRLVRESVAAKWPPPMPVLEISHDVRSILTGLAGVGSLNNTAPEAICTSKAPIRPKNWMA